MSNSTRELTDDLAGDIALLEGIQQTTFNMLGCLHMGVPLSDEDLQQIFQRVMVQCHHAAAQPGAVNADTGYVALLDYLPEAATSIPDLLGSIVGLFGQWPESLRQAGQRLPASQWTVIGAFFRHGLVLLHGGKASDCVRAPVAPTELLEDLVERDGADAVLRQLHGRPDDEK